MVIQTNQALHSTWSSFHEDISSDNDEEIMNLTKSIIDVSSPNDDIWRKFALPLTPPSSPSRSFGETTASNENTADDCCSVAERLQFVCDSLDATFDITNYNVSRLTDNFSLRSNLISDCMWSGNHCDDVQRYLCIAIASKKIKLEKTEEDLYPTPCPSPPPSVTANGADCPSSNDCVDPTTVFPFTWQNESQSTQSDTDEEIDVVTVDSKPLTIVGVKRKHSSPIIYAKAPTSPELKKVKSCSPAKLNPSDAVRKVLIADDSDPETRRATHNVLERKRRIDLKKSFERLRDCVPHLEKQEKSPKVVVLRKAAVHIEDLTREEQELAEEKRLLQKEKRDLVNKLRQLLNIKEEIVF